MEKYSTYRDQATGIAPFFPNKPPQASILTRVSQLLIGAFVFPLAFLGILVGLFIGAVPGVGVLYFRYVATTVLRLFYVNLSYEGERKASVRKSEILRAQPGDVIISNFVSPLDPIVYSSFFNCQFVFPNNGKFIPSSLLGACCQALSLDLASGPGKPIQDIAAQAKANGKVVVLFGEGTTSNGKGVLSLKNVDWSAIGPLTSNVFTSAIKYTPASICSPLGGNLLGYLWTLETSVYWCMASVHVSKSLAKDNRTKLGASSALSLSCRTRLIGDTMDIASKQQYYKVSRR